MLLVSSQETSSGFVKSPLQACLRKFMTRIEKIQNNILVLY